MSKLKNKHLLTLLDYSKEEILQILTLAQRLKKERKEGKLERHLKDKTVALIFEKSSTRTRVSFEQGVIELGGHPMFLSADDIQIKRGESIEDTAKVLSRYVDAIMIRTFKQSVVEDLAKHGTIPIINGLTDDFHPCQALADLLTITENFGTLEGIKMVYMGDGNNVAASLAIAGAKCGMQVVLCSPEEFSLDKKMVEKISAFGLVTSTSNIQDAVKNAKVIYTDVFFSMGQAKDEEKENALMPYQVNKKVMQLADKNAIFLHCLPAHRGEEVTAEVIDGTQSKVFDQAENRLHVQKAVMSLLIQ